VTNHSFYTADVFTSARFGGNQLAVFPDAEGIDPAVMQSIAREFNLSETTFVLRPKDPRHTRHVRIFTPAAEVQFAGHPTVGTAFVLATAGLVELTGDVTTMVLEEGVGPVPVTIRSANGRPDFAQLTAAQLPEYGPPAPAIAALARVLSLDASDIRTDAFAAESATCGLPFLFVPLESRAAVSRARPRLDEWDTVLGAYWAKNIMVFCSDDESTGTDYRARMFAPTLGVPEDPATGSACAALGGYLAKRDARRDGTLKWVVQQGVEMGRPSVLEIEVDKSAGAVTAVRVGGNSVLVTKGELILD
jgi:trans-2,3-dihydro-3-hydroxyanthranilate isomerase